jgi:hypothetical protein
MKPNKKIISAVVGAAMVGFGTYSLNSMAAQETGATATTTIVGAIGISQTTAMSFGDITTSGAGTVVLDTADTVSGDASNTPAGGTVSTAVFGITGDNVGYVLTMPASISLTGPGTAMTIDTFTYLAEDAQTDGTGTIAGGVGTMRVGGTLNINSPQTAGTYNATYTVTALYE